MQQNILSDMTNKQLDILLSFVVVIFIFFDQLIWLIIWLNREVLSPAISLTLDLMMNEIIPVVLIFCKENTKAITIALLAVYFGLRSMKRKLLNKWANINSSY